ncbi:MAG: UMP kinase [Phycisphaerales bacterium]|nr:UMP kinase [Phycisphaerales bacterium]
MSSVTPTIPSHPHARQTHSMPDAPKPYYRRVVLKVSGESFAKQGEFGIDPDELALMAQEIKDATICGTQVAVVVGGGNIIRGAVLAAKGQVAQATADYMGMLATVINALALKEALETIGQPARVLSAINLTAVAEPFIRGRALRHLEKGRVVILAAGTGNPFFTTDTCAALRGAELGADILLKATKVDGVYDRDPVRHADATRFEKLTFSEALERKLRVMDLTALSMCMEHRLPVKVFDFKVRGNIRRVIEGAPLGTLITA